MEFLTLLYALLAALVGIQSGEGVSAPVTARMEASVFAQCRVDSVHASASQQGVAQRYVGYVQSWISSLARAGGEVAQTAVRLPRIFGTGTFAVRRE